MTLSCSEAGSQHPPLSTHVIVLLEAVGFEYELQLEPEDIDGNYPAYVLVEQYFGWEIQSAPFFAVVHIASGHVWVPRFDETKDVERTKVLILEGIKVDLEKELQRGAA